MVSLVSLEMTHSNSYLGSAMGGRICNLWLKPAVLLYPLLADLAVAAGELPLHRDMAVGAWIWDSETYDLQEVRLARSFTIPEDAEVVSARLRVTADNSFHLYLDGQLIGQGSDWHSLIEYDVRLLLTPGEHVLAVNAVNDFGGAGLLLGLRVELSDGRVVEVASDSTWKIAPREARRWTARSRPQDRWPAATVVRQIDPAYRPQTYQAPVSLPLEQAFWQRSWFQSSVSIVALVGIASGFFLSSRLFLKSRMEEVVRRERERIAVDLHDDLGGGLTQLVLLGEKTRQEIPEDSSAAKMIERLCEHSRGLLRGMNETVWLINSRRDTISDFASYVARYAECFFRDCGVRCRFDIVGDLPPLPCDLGVRRNLFLAVKEALNNVVRHGRASVVELGIRRERNELVVTVRDDGCGFDPLRERDGNGLRNMATRAAEAGARFRIDSRPGAGSAIEFRVPLQALSRLGRARLLPWKRRLAMAEPG